MRNLNCLPILLTIHRVWKKFYCFIYLGLLMEEVLQNFRKIVSQKTFKFITDCIPQSNFQQGFKKFHRYFKGSWWSKILQKKLTVSPTEFWVQNSPHSKGLVQELIWPENFNLPPKSRTRGTKALRIKTSF